jgi:hypothetical protein
MPRYGFNGEKTEMKVFILFIMRHVLEPVTLDDMSEMILIDDNMNYFLFSEYFEWPLHTPVFYYCAETSNTVLDHAIVVHFCDGFTS